MIKQESRLDENRVVALLLLAVTLFFALLAAVSEEVFDGSDNYIHYLISHYAFKHPYLLIDHWGKPVFTALSSPFTHFGFTAAKLFNVLCGTLSALLVYLTAKKLQFKGAWIGIVILTFTPIYFIMLTSTLTEILFSLILILSVYLFLSQAYFLSIIIISFLPYVRSEGIVLLPIFLLLLMNHKKYKLIPWLAFGTLFYTIIGNFYYHDLLWLIHRNPYNGAAQIYGHGPLLHFIANYNVIFGAPLTLLIVIGLSLFMADLVLNTSKNGDKSSEVKKYDILFLIVLPAIVFLLFHSFLWWKGLGGSLGLIRVMASIIPLTTLMCLRTIDFIHRSLISLNKWLIIIVYFGISLAIVIVPFRQFQVPMTQGPTESLMKKTADWILSNEYTSKVYYFNPILPFFLNADPYDHNKCCWMFYKGKKVSDVLNNGELIIWDAHFGPNEGKLPLDTLLHDDHLQLLKVFNPPQAFTVLGGYDYQIYVFQRTLNAIVHPVLIAHEVWGELPAGKVFTINPKVEFSPTITLPVDSSQQKMEKLKATVTISSDHLIRQGDAALVIEIVDKEKQVSYKATELASMIHSNGQHTISVDQDLSFDLSNGTIAKVYIWNPGKSTFDIENFKVTTFSPKPQ